MGKEKDEVKAPKAAKEEWVVNLLIADEDQPPKKYITKGKESLSEHAALAKILNELEKINEALLS